MNVDELIANSGNLLENKVEVEGIPVSGSSLGYLAATIDDRDNLSVGLTVEVPNLKVF